MNRLVIIGNGFDLAYKLPTSYNDFITDYLKRHIKQAISANNGISGDSLIKVVYNRRVNTGISWLDQINTVEEIKNHSFCDLSINKRGLRATVVGGSTTSSNSNSKPIKFSYKSEFFKKLIQEQNWADIEKTYFDALLEIDLQTDTNSEEIEKLNKDFKCIKTLLSEYITAVEKKHDYNSEEFKPKWFLYDCFNSIDKNLYESHFYNKLPTSIQEIELQINNLLFLNFNYTSLLDRLIEKVDPEIKKYHSELKYRIVDIHRKVTDERGVIFGYGDDSHPIYKQLEDANNPNLLHNIKSFYYPSDNNYRIVDSFIEADNFEVFILGHSLGLSDRVLLKTIFENENCKAIRLYHRGEQSQFQKRIALSRHFDDKISMRKKVEVFNDKDVLQ